MIPSLTAYTHLSGASSGLLELVTVPFRMPLGILVGGVGEGDARAGSLPLTLSLLGRTASSSSSETSVIPGAGDQFLDILRCLLRPRGYEEVPLLGASPIACCGEG